MGNWKLNMAPGCAAALLTFVFSLMNNTWLTSLIRSVIGFLCFFVLGFFLHAILKQSLSLKRTDGFQDTPEHIKGQEEWKSEEREEVSNEAPFQSVSLPSLHAGMETADASENIAKTIRTWTSQNRRGNG